MLASTPSVARASAAVVSLSSVSMNGDTTKLAEVKAELTNAPLLSLTVSE